MFEESGGVNAPIGTLNAPIGTLKKIAHKLDSPEGTIRRWKHEYMKERKKENSFSSDNSKDTMFKWSTQFKSQLEKELSLNSAVQEIRDTIFKDRKKKIKELILWEYNQLEDIRAKLMNEEITDKEFDYKLSVIDKYMSMNYKMLGIKYTTELVNLAHTVNKITANEEKLIMEREKLTKNDITDKHINLNIKGVDEYEKDKQGTI